MNLKKLSKLVILLAASTALTATLIKRKIKKVMNKILLLHIKIKLIIN